LPPLEIGIAHKSFAARDLTAIRDSSGEITFFGQIVLYEFHITQGAFDESGVRERSASELAIDEFAADEVCLIEQSPRPLDIFEGTVYEVGVDHFSVCGKSFEIAEFEVVVFPLDCCDAVAVNYG
jgi:hypothetical protein